jgi:hypothetical protein
MIEKKKDQCAFYLDYAAAAFNLLRQPTGIYRSNLLTTRLAQWKGSLSEE